MTTIPFDTSQISTPGFISNGMPNGLMPNMPNGSAPYAQMVLVTPEIAEHWLKHNDGNRKLRPAMVKALAKAMREGRFVINGDTAKISRKGKMMDAQHRMAAIVETGIPQWILFVYNIDEDAMGTIDQGANRTVADILAIRGVDVVNVNVIAGAARLLTETTDETTGGLQRGELADYIEDHLSEMVELGRWAAKVSVSSPMATHGKTGRRFQSVSPTILLGLVIHMIRAGAHPETVLDFFEVIIGGATGLSANTLHTLTDERLEILQSVQRRLKSGGNLNNSGGTAWVPTMKEFETYIRAYNAWVRNEPIQRLQSPKNDYRWLSELVKPDARALV